MASNPVPRGGEAPNSTAIPIIQNIFGVSSDFLGQLRTWLEQNPPSIPVTQIIGFSQFTPTLAATADVDTTSSLSYVQLTHTGPTLSGLSDGKYLVLHGCLSSNSVSGDISAQAIKVNSTSAADTNWCITETTVGVSISRAFLVTLASGSNTLDTYYRVSGGTGTFSDRWLIALRYANA